MQASLLAKWLRLCDKDFYDRAFSPLVTLWYLVFQRLADNHTLQGVVADARNGGADRLSSRHKPLSRQLKSDATTSYSDARQRLPLVVLEQALRHLAAAIQEAFQTPRFHGLKVAVLDGSTVRLRGLGDIPKTFKPHRVGKRKQKAYWCLARVVGVFCLATGAVIDSVMDATKHSEQQLGARIFQRRWPGWLLLADRNFGIYSSVGSLQAAGAHLLVRLTRARAASLARRAGIILQPGLDAFMRWTPTCRDQLPGGMERQPIPGRLMAVELKRPGATRCLILYLFTTLTDPSLRPEQWAQLYGRRWSAELCLRDLKTHMGLELLECHSAQMGRKEWLAGLIAYNLIRYTMGAAAAVHALPVHVLSFTRTRQLLVAWLTRYGHRKLTVPSWTTLLDRVAKARLPKRKKKRPSEPRAIRKFSRDLPTLVGSRAAARRKLAKAKLKS